MSNRLGTIAISISASAIALILLSLDAYLFDDGINMKLAPKIAEVLRVISDSPQSEPSFKPSRAIELSETTAIYIVGGLGILLGLISVVMGFFSIKRDEHPAISFGAIALGIGPIILVSIKIALVCFIVIGPAAIWYKKQLTRRLNTDAQSAPLS